jgi:hypothetical protein
MWDSSIPFKSKSDLTLKRRDSFFDNFEKFNLNHGQSYSPHSSVSGRISPFQIVDRPRSTGETPFGQVQELGQVKQPSLTGSPFQDEGPLDQNDSSCLLQNSVTSSPEQATSDHKKEPMGTPSTEIPPTTSRGPAVMAMQWASESTASLSLLDPIIEVEVPDEVKNQYVFLAVSRGGRYEISQIQATNLQDSDLFSKLGEEYRRWKGGFRKMMSVWNYSHCEFTTVRPTRLRQQKNNI